jgi:NUMOD3 motif
MSLRSQGSKNPMYGRKHTLKTREAISLACSNFDSSKLRNILQTKEGKGKIKDASDFSSKSNPCKDYPGVKRLPVSRGSTKGPLPGGKVLSTYYNNEDFFKLPEYGTTASNNKNITTDNIKPTNPLHTYNPEDPKIPKDYRMD